MTDSTAERWPLPSGMWLHDASARRWVLEATPSGLPVSPLVSPADRSRWVGASAAAARGTDAPTFPPEFAFSPDDGAALVAAESAAALSWVPPFGAAPMLKAPRPGSDSCGLRQTTRSLRPRASVRNGRPRPLSPTDDAPLTLDLPPPGRYEFCVGRFGAIRDVLMAIEPEKGALFAWAPSAQTWLPMEPITAGPFAESIASGNDWRMESTQDGASTVMVLATASGLAVICADVLSLTYSVAYRGDGAALGAPIRWSGEVWVPVRSTSGALLLCSAAGPVVDCSSVVDPVSRFAPPVGDSRQVIWPSEQGQLVLRRNADGKPEASWVRWPRAMVSRPEFGCPYLSRSGSFWQLCWDEAADGYGFVQMARVSPETHSLDSPRFCTGLFSFQRGHWIKSEPWLDEAQGYDANVDEIVVPLLESTAHAAVLGLVIETTSAASELLESGVRQRAVLRYQAEDSPDLAFFTLQVARPWNTRVFVYDECLWVYHPDLPEAHGWGLEP